MTNESELEVWKDRWVSLDKSIENLVNQFDVTRPGHLSETIPRRDTICNLLKRLKVFGASHFNYFYQRFHTDKLILENLKDEKKYRYPPAMVLRVITDQIATDLQIITRALNQRQPYGANSEIKEALENADKLGQMALRPAIDGNLIDENTTVVTYFQKSMTVRVIPYANVAIIGVPFTALEVTRDYLAIPHEVAHYIFRHGGTNSGLAISLKAEQMFNKNNTPKYLRNWIEETFADLYGCLVAGPVMAIDFQDLQLDDLWEEFQDATIDEEDPVPVVRPDIYTKVLGRSKKAANRYAVAKLLQDRWDSLRDNYMERENGAEDITFRVGNNKDIKLGSIRKKGRDFDPDNSLPLDSMLQRILKQFFVNIVTNFKRGNQGYLEWSGNLDDINKGNLDTKLYGNFEGAYKTIEQVNSLKGLRESIQEDPQKPVVWFPPCDDVSEQLDDMLQGKGMNVSKLWVDYVKKWARRKGFNTINDANKIEELLELKRCPRTNDDSMSEIWGWVDLALAEGWVTRGPEPNPTGE